MQSDQDELLVPLSQLGSSGTRYTDDPRGWPVLAANGVRTGRVQDVLVDTRDATPRAFVVELGADTGLGSAAYQVVASADQARVDPARREVRFESLSWSEIALLPRHGEEPKAEPQEDATLLTGSAGAPAPRLEDEVKLTLFEEELSIGKRSVSAGEVLIRKDVEVERVRETIPVMREEVEIERRPLPPGAGFEPRVEGDATCIPIVEEEIVVQKRLVAREEIVVRKRQVVEEQVIEETRRRDVIRTEGPHVREVE